MPVPPPVCRGPPAWPSHSRPPPFSARWPPCPAPKRMCGTCYGFGGPLWGPPAYLPPAGLTTHPHHQSCSPRRTTSRRRQAWRSPATRGPISARWNAHWPSGRRAGAATMPAGAPMGGHGERSPGRRPRMNAPPDLPLRRIEDYAMIGDCHTAAWSAATARSTGCAGRASTARPALPRWSTRDAGAGRAGGSRRAASRQYRPGTMILETIFATARARRADRLHAVGGTRLRRRAHRGRPLRAGGDARSIALRFEYGSVDALGDAAVHRLAAARSPGRTSWCCTAACRCTARELTTVGPLHRCAPGSASRSRWRMARRTCRPGRRQRPDARWTRPRPVWTAWCPRCTIRASGASAVLRSLLTLKALTYPDRRHRRRADHLAARAAGRRRATGTTATAGCATPRSRCWR